MVNRRKGENKSMKKLIIIALAVASAATMYAQGTVNMVSRNAVYYGPYAGALAGTKVGSECVADLMYEGQVMFTQPFAMSPKGEPTGKLKGDIVTTPLPPGTLVEGLTVKAYNIYGFFYPAESAPFSYRTGDPATMAAPEAMLNYESFVIDCPEPTTIALGILGLGSLLVLRRRR